MTDKEIKWLVSLSLISLFGPYCDVDYLGQNEFYKKGNDLIDGLEANIYLDQEIFKGYESQVKNFLSQLQVSDAKSFESHMDQLLNGSEFAKNAETLLQYGRMMSFAERKKRRTIVVDDVTFLYGFFEELMKYEFHWPKNGLRAYELATAVMLLRLGVDKEYIDTTRQRYYYEDIKLRIDKIFTSYEDFGSQVVIGGNIHSKYLEVTMGSKIAMDWNEALSIAYHSVWQHIERP